MKIKPSYLIVGLLLACTIILFLVYPEVTPQDRLKEEKKIYYAFVGSYVVLEERTTVGWVDSSDELLEYIKSGLPEVEQETLIDFQTSNQQSNLLRDYFPEHTPYVFITQAEYEQIYQDGWEVFYEKYPRAYGVTSFSRIGFNTSFSQALVLKRFQGSNSIGDGTYSDGTFILLQKSKGEWIIIREFLAWIS